MESRSSHNIINELLILVVRVATTISFMIANFVTYEKVLIMMLHIERSLSLLTFSKIF